MIKEASRIGARSELRNLTILCYSCSPIISNTEFTKDRARYADTGVAPKPRAVMAT